jgi:Domain of unknown function (DUF4304)
MHPASEKMKRALQACAVPALRRLGFKGSFPHFRRVRDLTAELLSFQFNKYGGSFCVELAVMTAEDTAPNSWRGAISLAKARVTDVNSNRHRLGAAEDGDYWFVFGLEHDGQNHVALKDDGFYDSIAVRVAQLVEGEALHWWESSNLSLRRTFDAAELGR